MTDRHTQPDSAADARALGFLAEVFLETEDAVPAPPPAFVSTPVPTLGEALQQHRRRAGWSSKQMAMALGASHHDYQRWQGDIDLPDADAVLRISELIDVRPLRVLRAISESARRILRRTLDQFDGRTSRLMAARQRGPDAGDADRMLVSDLPLPLRRLLAEDAGTGAQDVDGMARLLRRYAEEDAERQRQAIEGLVAGLELEGEEAWRAESPL